MVIPQKWTASQIANRNAVFTLILTFLIAACGGGNAAPAKPTDIPPDVVKLSFVYGSEKKDWVNAVTQTFNNEKRKTASGKTIFVDALPLGSGESVTDILNGTLTPALWSPASAIWIPIVNDNWAQQKQKDFIDLANEPCKNAVLSPVVIAMWKPMAQALGWPDKAIGWSDIANISTSANGWADYGQPQLGAFRFGHTHPDYSNSGLQTIIAMAYASSQPGRVLTLDDVQKPETATFINKLESAIAHYGSSTGFFGDAMIQRGPTYLSAAVVYESIVASSYDANGKQKNPDYPLVAIYPKEGTFLSDHPMCIPDTSWMTPDLREAAKTYRDYLLSKPAQEQALQFGFRPADPSVAIGAPIDAAHGVDPKQPQTVLAVPDAKTIRAVRDLWKVQKRQVNLSLVIDISGSMRNENKMAGAREGAKAFVDLLDPTDNLTLIAFDDRQDVLFENVNVGEKRQEIKNKLDLLLPRGGTALFDSIAFATGRMKIDPKRINALVVMTDGQDTDSTRYKSAAALMDGIAGIKEGSQAPQISLFSIGYGSDADAKVLGTIAQRGGGKYSSGNTTDIQAVFRDIATFF
jgi:Ca-activated chloride channel family protein